MESRKISLVIIATFVVAISCAVSETPPVPSANSTVSPSGINNTSPNDSPGNEKVEQSSFNQTVTKSKDDAVVTPSPSNPGESNQPGGSVVGTKNLTSTDVSVSPGKNTSPTSATEFDPSSQENTTLSKITTVIDIQKVDADTTSAHPNVQDTSIDNKTTAQSADAEQTVTTTSIITPSTKASDLSLGTTTDLSDAKTASSMIPLSTRITSEDLFTAPPHLPTVPSKLNNVTEAVNKSIVTTTPTTPPSTLTPTSSTSMTTLSTSLLNLTTSTISTNITVLPSTTELLSTESSTASTNISTNTPFYVSVTPPSDTQTPSTVSTVSFTSPHGKEATKTPASNISVTTSSEISTPVLAVTNETATTPKFLTPTITQIKTTTSDKVIAETSTLQSTVTERVTPSTMADITSSSAFPTTTRFSPRLPLRTTKKAFIETTRPQRQPITRPSTTRPILVTTAVLTPRKTTRGPPFLTTSVAAEVETSTFARTTPGFPETTSARKTTPRYITEVPTTKRPVVTTTFETQPRSTPGVSISPSVRFPEGTTISMTTEVSKGPPTTPETPVNAIYSLKFQGECKPIMNDKIFRQKFQDAVIKIFVHKVDVPQEGVLLDDISCGSVNVTVTLEGILLSKVNSRLDEIVKGQVPFTIVSEGVGKLYIPHSYRKMDKLSGPDPERSSQKRNLSSSEVTIIIVVCVLGFLLIVIVIGLLIHECRKRSHTKSFDLRGTPRANASADDFTLTKMERGETRYDENGIIISPPALNGGYHGNHEKLQPVTEKPPQNGVDNPTYDLVESESPESPSISLLKTTRSSVDTGIENPSFSSEDMLDSGTEMDKENSSLIGISSISGSNQIQVTADTLTGSDSGRQSDSTTEAPSSELESPVSQSPPPGSNLSLNEEDTAYEPMQFGGGTHNAIHKESMLPIKEEVTYPSNHFSKDNEPATLPVTPNTQETSGYEMVERKVIGAHESDYVLQADEGATAF